MIPVTQTRLMAPRDDQGRWLQAPGNCWTACVASILELPIDHVPDESTYWQPGLTERQSWRPFSKAMHEFIGNRGYLILPVTSESLIYYEGGSDLLDRVYSVGIGISPRDPKAHHAVVCQGTRIVHDPHPDRTGLTGAPESFEFFLKMDPAR